MKKALMLLVAGLVSVSFADQKLAQQKGCMACHGMKEKKVGPSYADIAKKYADKPDAVDYLAGKIRKVVRAFGGLFQCLLRTCLMQKPSNLPSGY